VGSVGEAIEVRPDGDGRWLAHADPDHQSITGMFGGWTSAVVLNAVLRSSETAALPVSMTINFVGSIPAGADVAVEVERIGGGRSIQHWRAAVRQVAESDVLATALVALAERRTTDPHVEPTMPPAADPATLEQIQAPPPQGLQTEIRLVSGEYASGRTAGSMWVRDASGRPLDHLHLAYLADQYAPRSFFWGVGFRPSATITMSVYFHATAEEIAEVGTDYILNEAVGTRGESSTSGQQARLWSGSGTLLATTEQLCWYR
jgi:acyl-CoA thioesterase